jgi:hypothetical protein
MVSEGPKCSKSRKKKGNCIEYGLETIELKNECQENRTKYRYKRVVESVNKTPMHTHIYI